MSEIRFTDQHEWLRVENGIATVGITKYAAEQLGDVVYVELPEPGKTLSAGSEAAVVESVKAASEIYAPIAGEVVEGNQLVVDEPDKVNEDPEGGSWFFRLRIADPAELDKLMTIDQYKEFIEGL
jgi:glycine cleavage system H protein